MTQFFTIGHSTRPLETFIEILRDAGVEILVDVRSIPRSRTNPQYNQDSLPPILNAFQIAYEHIDALGGRRPKQRGISSSVNDFWKNVSFHNYADYALTPPFRQGLAKLFAATGTRRSAIMCAEAVWWRCHRRIISDYLVSMDRPVVHLLGPGQASPARITPGAVLTPDGALYYPGRPSG
jgi:uncharacterized protein (DUF488 family)